MTQLNTHFREASTVGPDGVGDGDIPAGGISTGVGFTIAWQNGPCPIQDDGTQPARNGAFLIEVLQACESRLEEYQDTKFACDENERALISVQSAILDLKSRLNRRKDAGTLGSHRPD